MKITPAQARQAFYRAADHIERNPWQFNYWSVSVPSGEGCGTPGCALGWIMYFLELDRGMTMTLDSINSIGVKDGGFIELDRFGRGWEWDTTICASALRKYADHHWPGGSTESTDLVECGQSFTELMAELRGEVA